MKRTLVGGPITTQRVLERAVLVEASPEEVWAAWTTLEGIGQFFAEDARIDIRPHGPTRYYSIWLLPQGARGARGAGSERIASLNPESGVGGHMESWKSMYLIIWISFLQILFILFSPFDRAVNLGVHVVIGVAVLVLAFWIYHVVRLTSCPDRIKRITRVTRSLAVLQGVLGVALALGVVLSWGSLYTSFVSFLHVGNALAIITQASSSATAYDMWEEKEFQVPTISQ